MALFSASGLPHLETESLEAEGRFLDDLGDHGLYARLLGNQAKAIGALESAEGQLLAAIEAAHSVLERPGSRLIYCGAGTSGRVALLDAVELNPTFNWPAERMKVVLAGGEVSFFEAQEGAEDDAEAARREIAALGMGPDDVVVGLAASGTTPFVLAALDEAKNAGALTVGFANNAQAPLLTMADCPVLLETGAEALAGSTRLAAGTSQKMALNIFSTALMVKLGKVYRGRMVDMQVTNTKLRARAVRMVSDIVGCDAGAAREALERSDFDVRQAVLVAHGAEVEQAEKTLRDNGGRLARAVNTLFGK